MSLQGAGMEPRCRCIATESRRIGKLIARVELFSPSPHCKDTEIIATLKESGKEICLDPNAHWVKRVIVNILSRSRRWNWFLHCDHLAACYNTAETKSSAYAMIEDRVNWNVLVDQAQFKRARESIELFLNLSALQAEHWAQTSTDTCSRSWVQCLSDIYLTLSDVCIYFYNVIIISQYYNNNK